ncbi:MAG: J domain-containing protein, partial [Candidatus Limnocylindrales bacterium]
MASRDVYRILQVHPEADPDVIQAAYRRLARRYHPDTPGGSGERMAELNAAYAVLNDPVRRADYDRQQGLEDLPAGPTTATPG